MMLSRLYGPAGAFWLPLVIVAIAHAQSATDITPQDRMFLERLALARARAQMLEQVWALPLKPDLTIGASVAQEVAPDRALRLWCRALPGYVGARHYSDATCDVDIRLTPETLQAQLREWLRVHRPLREGRIDERDLAQAAKDWPVLWSTGGAALTERSQTRQPDGWEDVTYEGMQVTRRAAAADARYALLEEAGRLKVTAARRLREFFDASDDVQEAVYDALREKATVRVECAPDQVAVAEARIGMTDLIRILTEVHQQRYNGEAFHAADFREMALLVERDELRATGLAAPPSTYIKPSPYRPIELDTPSWAAQTLSTTGRYEPADDEIFPEIVRAELARFDGMDNLRRKVEALVIQKNVTVTEFLGYHRELKDDVVLFLSGTRIVGTPQELPDGGVEARVELPLQRLWHIVRRAMQLVEVEPTAPPTPEETP